MMGELEIVIGIVGVVLIAVVLFYGLQFFASFYDFSDMEGDLGIDTDAVEDLGAEIDETNEIIFEKIDTEGLGTALGSVAVIIGMIIGGVFIVYMITKK